MNRNRTDHLVVCPSKTAPEAPGIGLKELDERDRKRGWFKCIYHFVIKRDGEIEHGHRHYREPAMGLGRDNHNSVSICLIGPTENDFTLPQLHALNELILELQDEYPDALMIPKDVLKRLKEPVHASPSTVSE